MEREFLHWLRQRISTDRRVVVGIGDDAAVLAPLSESLVVTTDTVTDQVDFRLDEVGARRAGRKALAVNLSDLAAMAARPLAAFVSLVVPRQNGLEIAQGVLQGMLPLAEEYDVPLAGGDTNSWDGALAISVTLLGSVSARGPLLRSGARPGDRLLATGCFGGSLLGHHLDFVPRVRQATVLHEQFRLHAGTDVSDGLAIDTQHLADESGCGAVLQLDSIPIRDAAVQAGRASGRAPLDHALGDGEDFELLLAVPPDTARQVIEFQHAALANVTLTDIGYFVSEPGLWSEQAATRRPLTATGWQHE